MIEPEEQGADATLETLASFLGEVFSILEAATAQATEFFGDKQRDLWLFPDLVRFFAKQALQDRAFEVVDEETDRLETEVLANNGLLLHYGPREIRVRKADHGSIPAATSETLRDFYEQPSLFGSAVDTQRLLLLWDTPGGVFELTLACPKTRDAAPHWKVPVPHPAELHAIDDDTRATEESFDLPIRLRDVSADEK
jgi:hypothetical protein